MRVGKAHLVKERGRYAAKPVAGHPMLVPKALKRFEDRVVRHRPLVIALTGKDIRRQISKLLEAAQRIDRLPGKRNDVRRPHLHARGWNAPFGSLQIELVP